MRFSSADLVALRTELARRHVGQPAADMTIGSIVASIGRDCERFLRQFGLKGRMEFVVRQERADIWLSIRTRDRVLRGIAILAGWTVEDDGRERADWVEFVDDDPGKA